MSSNTILSSLPTGVKVMAVVVILALAIRRFRTQLTAQQEPDLAEMMATSGGFLASEYEKYGLVARMDDSGAGEMPRMIQKMNELRVEEDQKRKVRFAKGTKKE